MGEEPPRDLSVVLSQTDKDAVLSVREGLTCEAADEGQWCGARASHGVKAGKVAFAVTILSDGLCRLGWSAAGSALALGTDERGFGYGCTAKRSNSGTFTDYGEPYTMGDVITALIDFDANVISFCKNGRAQGEAFRVWDWLRGVPMYPHVLTKNCRVRLFFGEGDRFEFPQLPDGFRWLGHVKRVAAPAEPAPTTVIPWLEDPYPGAKVGPAQRRLIVLVGLPGAGKTHWAQWYTRTHPELGFKLISISLVLQHKMPSAKWSFDDGWAQFIKAAGQAVDEQLEAASKADDNVIWDQTNVYPVARQRKLEKFRDFHKTAVVFIPPEKLHRKWVEAQREQVGQNVPDHVVAQMRHNFELPREKSADGAFDRVLYAFRNEPDDVSDALLRYKCEGGEAPPAAAAPAVGAKRPREEPPAGAAPPAAPPAPARPRAAAQQGGGGFR